MTWLQSPAGDTSIARYPLGVFDMSSATTAPAPLASFQLMQAFVTNKLDELTAPPAPVPAPAPAEPAARKLTQSSILRAAVARTLAKQRAEAA